MSKPDFAGVVTGDWHLDRFNRLEDFIRCVDFVIDTAVFRKGLLDQVHSALTVPFHFTHTGDGYKTYHPAPIEMRAMHRTSVLRNKGIDGDIVVGNHDTPESEEHGGVHCFTEMKTLGGGLNVIDEPQIKILANPAGAKLVHILIPHIPKAHLQRAKLSYRDFFVRCLNELIVRAQDQAPGAPILLFTHCYIKEAAVGTSDLIVESDRQISVEDLKDTRLTAAFLGDIHKAQKLNEKPLVLYPGSIDRIDFGEANDAKGMVYYEVHGREIKVDFIATPARRFLHIVADLVSPTKQGDKFFGVPDQPSAIQPWLEEKFKDYEVKGAIIKVTLRVGPNQKSQIDDRRLTEVLVGLGADRVRSVNFDVVTADQRRAPEITESLSPVAALERWVETQNYQDMTKQQIVLAGKKIIGVAK